MPNYPVTDNVTGDKWVINADSPERARQIAALRRAAKQGTLKYESPADEPTLLSFLEKSISAPYEGKPSEIPGFFGSLGRTYKEAGQTIGRELLPPFMRPPQEETFDPARNLGQAGEDVLKVVGAAPPVAAMQAAADTVGKLARGWGASPLTAGILAQGAGLAYPSYRNWAARRGERALEGGGLAVAKTGAAERFGPKEAERIEYAAKPGLKDAAELQQRRAELAQAQREYEEQRNIAPSQRLAKQLPAERAARTEAETAEAKTAEQAKGLVEQTDAEARRKIAQAEDFSKLTDREARVALEDMRTFPQVAQSAAEAVKKRIASNPVSEFEFGEAFKGPEFQPRGQPQGYYRSAEALRRAEADQLYSAARQSAAGAVIPAEKILDPIMADLSAQGIAVEALPTSAERTGARVAEAIQPEALSVKNEEQAYERASEQLTQAQYDYLKTGKGSTPGTPGSNVPAIPKSVVDDLVAAMQKGKRGANVPTRDLDRIMEQRAPQVQGVPVEDAMNLHQRLNGAIRAAERSKDFALTRTLRRYKDIVDRAINDVKPEALQRLAEADLNYAREYSPYFDPRSKLFKISQQKAASIVDSLVSKTDPRLTEKALSILSEEGKDALRGAWTQRVFENAVSDFGNRFDPKKLAETYKSYLPEVREAILGKDAAQQMDRLVDGLAKRAEELQDVRRGIGERQRLARESVTEAKAAAPLARKEAQARAKEMTAAAAARTGTAREAEQATMQRLARGTTDLAKQTATKEAALREAQKMYDQLADKLARDTAKFATEEAERKAPKGMHMIMGMSNMQVQAALGLMDIAEFAGGAGGRRYIVFAARHALIYYLAKHPEQLGVMARGGKRALEILNGAVNGNPLSPRYINQARAAWLLAEQAELESARERNEQGGVRFDFKDERGNPRPPTAIEKAAIDRYLNAQGR